MGFSAPGPGRSCERDGRRQKHHGVSIRQARHRCAGTLGSRDQAHDPGICALGRTPCRHQMEGFAGIGRSAQDRIPHLPPHRHGFAGQRRLVEHGGAVHDRAIDRHDVAFADNETIARLDRLQRNLLQPAVPLSKGSTRHAGQQGRHLTAGATLGKALEILPARIHHRDDGRGQVFRKQKGREHGERGDDVQTHIAATQADDDLDHEDDKNRSRGRSPYRARPMLPSKEMRCESENQPGRGPYNEDRPKKRPHFRQGPEPLGRAGQYQIVSHTLRCLDRSEIEHEAARIFACEPECRHIGMTNHEPFAQSVAERIEDPPCDRGYGTEALRHLDSVHLCRRHDIPRTIFERGPGHAAPAHSARSPRRNLPMFRAAEASRRALSSSRLPRISCGSGHGGGFEPSAARNGSIPEGAVVSTERQSSIVRPPRPG